MAISLDLDSFSLSRQSEYSLRRLILESNCSLVFMNNIKSNKGCVLIKIVINLKYFV